MKPKHTKAPWTVENHGIFSGSVYIACVYNPIQDGLSESADISSINAKLIAASPDLLAALLEIKGIYADTEKNNGLAELLSRVASNAIEKAGF